MRLLLLLAFPLFAQIDLRFSEKSFYSPHGEDGILAQIFHELRPVEKIFVEIGSGYDFFGSTTYLLKKQGWKSFQFDRIYENRDFITAENVNSYFRLDGVPYHTNLLSIRLKYNAYHIWKAVDPIYRPDVVMIRYNPFLPPAASLAAEYRPYYCGDNTSYFGASILALYHLGRGKGYSLVYAEQSGHYLFFIRDDLAASLGFKDMNDPEKLYRPPTYTVEEDPKRRAFLPADAGDVPAPPFN